MKTKFIYILSIIFGGLVAMNLIACQGSSKETVREIIRETPVSKGSQDSAGGDCVKSKDQCIPIEEFRVELRTQKTYVEILQPLLEKLEAKSPRLAANLIHIAQERTWYRLPAPLEQLPNRIKGIAFETEQMALQNLQAVFIDDLLYAPISVSAQAKLLLHELVMGVRLMDYQSDLDQCFAAAALELGTKGSQAVWKEKRSGCYKTSNPLPANKTIQLDGRDYENVRTLTSKLINEIDSLESKELENWLRTSKFRVWDERFYP